MRRRPKEDNEEQRKRLEPDFAGSSGPPDHRRQRSCSATDDDVLSRGSLQPRRVHDNIKEDGAGQQCGCREVRRQPENRHREPAQNETKDKRLDPGDFAAGNWPHRGAGHDRIDIGVVPHVERAGGCGPRGNGKNRGKSGQRIKSNWSDAQSDERGEDGKHHHTWLCEGDEGRHAPTVSQRIEQNQTIMPSELVFPQAGRQWI